MNRILKFSVMLIGLLLFSNRLQAMVAHLAGSKAQQSKLRKCLKNCVGGKNHSFCAQNCYHEAGIRG